MNILYDHEIFSYQQYGGIARYYCEMIQRLNSHKDSHCRIGAKFSNTEYLKQGVWRYPFPNSIRAKQLFFRINSLYFKFLLKTEKYDLVHFTFYPDPKWKKLIRKPIVITVHDMIPELFPSQFPNAGKWISNKKFWCHNADMILTNSDSTSNDLLKVYNHVDPKRVHRVYLGSSPAEKAEKSCDLPETFLLYVGGRQSYKNFNNLLQAFRELTKKHKQLHLICTGGGSFSSEETKMLEHYGLTDHVQQRSCSESALAGIYQRASALVYPSLYEGFGLPLLEAFQARIPIAISNASCFPEIAGNAAVYFDPHNVSEIKNALETVLFDQNGRTELIAAGTKRLAHFSWEKTAEKTLFFYHQLIESMTKE